MNYEKEIHVRNCCIIFFSVFFSFEIFTFYFSFALPSLLPFFGLLLYTQEEKKKLERKRNLKLTLEQSVIYRAIT